MADLVGALVCALLGGALVCALLGGALVCALLGGALVCVAPSTVPSPVHCNPRCGD